MRKYPLSLLKDKNIVTFFDFWGKTRRGEKDGGDDYHLLCWHSLDVAAMGYLMVKRNCFGLADYFRQLGISDKEQAAQFFAWLLCWHDIGKFARSFQQLYLPPELKIQEGARKNYEKISHSTLGYWLWNHYLSECQELLPSSSLSPRKLRRVIEMWIATRKDVERSVSVGWLHSEQECIARIESAVSQGKCIAWIRNSVDDAIKVHRQLLARGVIPASSLSLFHSRFAFSDRQRIETETLARFGKEDSSQRAGKVLICTQVLEQSVDCDLDEMISDLAPVDLLIQRAGRLQRHIRDINGQLKRDGKDERSPPELLILAPVWDDSPGDEWFGSAMRNSAFVYPDHGRIWLTQRVLREQGAIQMPHAARLLIESVYGEDVVMPEGFARSEQEQVGKYYCDRAMAKKFVLNFRPGYAANINDYLPEKLSTRLAEESVSLWLATCIDGVVKPYATGAHAWEMSVVRVRRSWWKKHRDEFSLLEGEAFRLWCIEQRQDPEMANVILVNDDESCGYSAMEGLIGKVG
ncbi:TPA: CRISPR-associated helicase Cas3' [Escherichia coli]|nr:CRISPR-associated helicase Cas3' [Escherichia coli]